MRKVISLILMAGLLMTAATGIAYANNGDGSDTQPPLSYYLPVTGKVVSVEEYEGQEGWLKVSIEDQNGNPAVLVLTENTVYPFENGINAGDTVTGYYIANAPMIMIWPPQYTIAILVAGMPDDLNVIADRFNVWEGNQDDYLLAQGGQFAFKIGEDTEVVLANGDDFTGGNIIGRRLVVIYSMSTRSIPELTTAVKVIVLYEDAVPLPEEVPYDGIDASGWPIIVDGKEIESLPAFQDGESVMMPLGAILEALGLDAVWDGDAYAVTVNDTIWFKIGEGTYLLNGEETKTIDGAPVPVIVEDRTFVPLRFFTEILGLPNAFAFEGVIEIHSTGESME